ncbi:BON domain-containing protein [Paraburkholderia sp. XV]|uniref:BON domain-containing protein n=1 Tax=Paraburkholderia sp. XV TaxID=2831520 RepID=UPI001CD559CB|nr:BON domain-containing protein [Paraburkholderia sp. XV]
MHRIIVRGITLVCLLFTLNAVAQPGQPASGNSNYDVASAPTSSKVPKVIRAANRALSKRVLKALSRIKGLDATGIFVKASDGNIILSGVVPEASQIPLAVQAASNVEGVKSVRESLRLATQPTQ